MAAPAFAQAQRMRMAQVGSGGVAQTYGSSWAFTNATHAPKRAAAAAWCERMAVPGCVQARHMPLGGLRRCGANVQQCLGLHKRDACGRPKRVP
eukprot:363910-Chlamydomonas_euryale.AAC.4